MLVAACGGAEAAPYTWSTGTSALTDGSGNWNATGGTNWFNGTTYGAWGNLNVDTATFGVGNGAAGTITVGSVTTNGITFNNATSGNYTLSSGTIMLAGTTPTIAVNASGTTTLTSVLAGSAGLTKTGVGTLLLGTGNTYTGTTTISQGAVRVTGITNTLGNGSTGAVNLNGGTLIGAWNTAQTSAWAITVGASGGTFLGSGSAGQLNLTTNSLYGSGVLTLRSEGGFNRFFNSSNAQNNFSGKWILDGSGGAFWDNFQATANWGTATGDDVVTLTNNGTVLLRSDLSSTTKGITVGAGGGTINGANNVAATISAKLSGVASGTVTFGPSATGGIITLTNTSNSYAGDTVVLGRTSGTPWLRLGATDVIPDGAGKGNVFITNSGGTRGALDLNGFNETINGLSSFNGSSFATDSIVDNLAASTSATLTLGGNNASATFAGVIQNTGSSATLALAKIGTGTQTLSGANAFSGATSINAGVLELGAGGTAGSLSGSSAVTIASGATLAFRRSNDYGSFANAVSGAGSVVVTSGTVTFTGSNSYSGSTTVNGGLLVAGTSSALGGSTTPLVINAGTVSLGGFSVAVGALSGSSGGAISTSNAAGTATFTTNVASGTSTFAGSIANNGSGVVALTKQGVGTLVLSGNNTYTGTTTISQGSVQVSGITNTLGNGSGGNVRLDGGAVILSTTSSLYPTWAIGVGAGGGTLMGSGSGGFWGVGSNTISGSGTLTLQSSTGFGRFQWSTGGTQNSFSGKWVIDGSGGAFVDNAQGSAWGVGAGDDLITLVNNATLLIRSGTLGNATQGITIGAGGATFNAANNVTAVIASKLSSTSAARVTFGPAFSDATPSVIVLSNTGNSYAGDTYIAGRIGGTPWLQLGAAGVLPDGTGKGDVYLVNGGARGGLDLNGFNETINALSSFNGSSFATDSIVDNLAASTSATLTLGGNNASATFAGVIQNTGSSATLALTKIGSGTQTLSGANTYSGNTTISGGVLALGTNGSLANSPVVRVGDAGSSGAVLDLTAKTGTFSFGSTQTVAGIGSITIGAGKTVRSQGIWAPGNSIGSNAVTGNLLLSGTSQFELGTPGASSSSPGSSDYSSVSGTLTLGGNLALLDNSGSNSQGSYGAGSYRLFTAPALSGTFASVTAPTGAATTRVGMVYTAGTASGQGVFANVYNLASAAGAQTVSLGNTRVGTALTGSVTLSNVAPNNATYSETLSTGGFSNTSSGFTTSGSASGIAGGGSGSGNLVVGLGTGLTAGAQTGTTTLALFSNAVNSSGLAQQSIAAQTITINGNVYDFARANFSGTTLNFGVVHLGASVAGQNVAFGNQTVTNASYQDSLDVLATTGNARVTATGFTGLAASASGTATNNLAVSVSTATAGSLTSTLALTLTSNANGVAGLSNGAAVTVGGGSITTTGGVFSGTASWNVNGGGSWGTGASANWTSAESVSAAPGTFGAGFTTTDSATFGNAVSSGTATVSLNGASVSLSSLALSNTNARYVIATGTGSGSLTLAADSGAPSVAVVGTHEIAAGILGSSGLSKRGLGTLVLSGSNSYSGSTTISAGVISFANKNAFSATSGISVGNGSGLTYTGPTDTFSKNITVTGGTGSVTNSGSGVLTLSGSLTKNGTVLRLTGGAFNVIGQIVGSSSNSDLHVDGAIVTLSNMNSYNGPTFVYNGGTLALGTSSAIPSNSVVTLGGPGTGTLDLGSYTNTIGGLVFSGSGGTLRMAANQTTAPQLATNSSLSLGAGTTLDLTGMGTSAGLYRLVSYPSNTGTFATVTGLDGGYQLVYGTTGLDAQQKAVLGAVTVTNPPVSIITGGSAAFTYTVANSNASGGASLSFTGSGLSNVAGSSSGSASAASPSTSISGFVFTGTSVGNNQQGTFTVSAPTAYGATSTTGTVTVNVLDHATSSLASSLLTSTTISLGQWNYATNHWETGSNTGYFSIYNLASDFGAIYTADLSLLDVTGTGNGFTTNLGSYADIAGGQSTQFSISFDPTGFSTSSTRSTTFQIKMSDKTGVSGATASNTLYVTANVIVVPEPGAIALAGIGIGLAGWVVWSRRRSTAK